MEYTEFLEFEAEAHIRRVEMGSDFFKTASCRCDLYNACDMT